MGCGHIPHYVVKLILNSWRVTELPAKLLRYEPEENEVPIEHTAANIQTNFRISKM